MSKAVIDGVVDRVVADIGGAGMDMVDSGWLESNTVGSGDDRAGRNSNVARHEVDERVCEHSLRGGTTFGVANDSLADYYSSVMLKKSMTVASLGHFDARGSNAMDYDPNPPKQA